MVPKADYCDWPVGLPSIPPHFPSFFLSSWPVALTLHDFLPCSLKALSLWRTHLTRGESLKGLSTFYPPFSFCCCCFIILPLSTHTPWLTSQDWSLLCRGVMISIVMISRAKHSFCCHYYWSSEVCRCGNLVPNLLLFAATVPPWWLFIILTSTATWRLSRGQHSGEKPENLNTYDEQIKSSYLLKEEQHSRNWKRRWCIWDFKCCTGVVLFMINSALLITLTLSLTSRFDGDLLGPVSCLRVCQERVHWAVLVLFFFHTLKKKMKWFA